MSTRQDAWSKDEDVLLAETVLRYIREGKTQMKAFEEVGHRLSRTPQACGFRWNANLRKHYRKAIDLAKQSRKKINDQPVNFESQSFEVAGDQRLKTVEQVIRQLEQLKGDYYKEEPSIDLKQSDLHDLKRQLTQYEQLIDEIYSKIIEMKKNVRQEQ
ncbi:RsfA family transcriptional regulator [Bacillaceae bacterium W0354]